MPTSRECEICGRTLSSKAHFEKHMKTIHAAREFRCDFDGRSFNTKDKLRLHMFNHRRHYRVRCEVCEREYKTDQSMRKHLRTHFQQHQCDNCGQVFKYKRLLDNHIAAIHEDLQAFQCRFCTRLFPNTTTRDNHEKHMHKDRAPNTKLFQCTECAAGFEMKEELRLHSFVHFDGVIHTCLDCNQIFKKKKLLTLHMKKHEMPSFACDLCQQMFKYKSNLNKHRKLGRCRLSRGDTKEVVSEKAAEIARRQMIRITKDYTRSIVQPERRKAAAAKMEKEEEEEEEEEEDCAENSEEKPKGKEEKEETAKKGHEEEEEKTRSYVKRKPQRQSKPSLSTPYHCDLCGAEIRLKSKLLSHMREHAATRRHRCKECSAAFRSRQLLHEHSMKVHSRGVFGSIDYSKSTSECEHCGKKLSAERMRTHISLHQRPKLVCDHCGRIFRTKMALDSHLRAVASSERKYTCSACGKSFKRLSVLRQHEETHNPYKVYVKCERCAKVLQMKHLRMHMEVRHGDRYSEKFFKCDACGKAFRYRKQLDKHSAQVHEAKSRGILYACGECELAFTRRHELRNHSFAHYAGPVFECSTCGLKFRKRKLLYVHSRVHGEGDTRVLQCDQCQCTFKTRGGLRKHVFKMHVQEGFA